MCGIAGATSATSPLLIAMREALAHRGPDDAGIWLEQPGGPGLAHTRLAVIDLSPGGHQPMESDCGRYVISYNGEIYNYRELKGELRAMGESFRSDSDTEVLLRLLRRYGPVSLQRLVGMFAFALWDRQERRLLLVRDRLGVKPLVYALLPDGGIAFASEIGALMSHPQVSKRIDQAGLSEYLACLYVPAPRTIYAGVKKLEPGTWLSWQDGRTRTERWWRPAIGGGRFLSLDEAAEDVLPLVRRAITDRMIADVDIGCFLSGGTDSSVIASVMAAERQRAGGPPVRSFTMTFDDPAYDERQLAREVAHHLGTEHTELRATAGLSGALDDLVIRFGEPFGNPTALLIHDLSRQAREHVTVALVGDGGDEVFAGYPRYVGGVYGALYRHVPRAIRALIAAGAERSIRDGLRGDMRRRRLREFLMGGALEAPEAYGSWVEYFTPEERVEILDGDRALHAHRPIAALYAASPSRHPLDAMQQTDLESFLPCNVLAYGDAMSMWHALELRHPLLDHRLIERVGQLAPEVRIRGGLKAVLKSVARRLLPTRLVDRPKRGFNPPIGAWLRHELAPLLEEHLHPARLRDLGLASQPVRRLIQEHRDGRRDHGLKLWALIVYGAWAQQSLQQPAERAVV